jgi:hypothetical protein
MTRGEASPSPTSDGAARALGALAGAAGRWPQIDQMEPDPALAAQGWERRFITDGGRAEEVVALYHQLGFEVRLEPVLPAEIPDGCSDCRLLLLFHFQTVYTRRPPSTRDRGAEHLPRRAAPG